MSTDHYLGCNKCHEFITIGINHNYTEQDIKALIGMLTYLNRIADIAGEMWEKLEELTSYGETAEIEIRVCYEILDWLVFDFYEQHKGHDLMPVTEYDAIDWKRYDR